MSRVRTVRNPPRAAASRTDKDAALRDRDITRKIIRWFTEARRDLPWRRRIRGGAGPDRRDPYASLVAEAMLQQTQVSRVLEYFPAFLRKFPTIRALALAREQEVLAAWAGLGYYRRARHLRAAAKSIVARFDGRVPGDVEDLRSLAGIGRYTAGAIASIVFGHRAPVVDGNVRRVLHRIEGRRDTSDSWAWERATALVRATDGPGALNEGLMELGATVCTPQAPRCDRCPLTGVCRARAEGTQEEIPEARARPARKQEYHSVVVVRDGRGRVLVEQRPGDGPWADMWQAPTLERGKRLASAAALRRWLGLAEVRRVDGFDYGLTHRLIRFEVWHGVGSPVRAPILGRWATSQMLRRLPLSNAQRRVLLKDVRPSTARRGAGGDTAAEIEGGQGSRTMTLAGGSKRSRSRAPTIGAEERARGH